MWVTVWQCSVISSMCVCVCVCESILPANTQFRPLPLLEIVCATRAHFWRGRWCGLRPIVSDHLTECGTQDDQIHAPGVLPILKWCMYMYRNSAQAETQRPLPTSLYICVIRIVLGSNVYCRPMKGLLGLKLDQSQRHSKHIHKSAHPWSQRGDYITLLGCRVHLTYIHIHI